MTTSKSTLKAALRRVRRLILDERYWAPIRQRLIRLTRIMANNFGGYDLIRGQFTYNQDGLATRHNCDFMMDETFLRAYRAGVTTKSWNPAGMTIESWKTDNPAWRAFVICWAAQQGMKLDGDFVECGVNRGGNARTIVDFVGFERSKKTFYLLDTFCGLVDSCLSPEEKNSGKTAGGYVECYEEVCKTFGEFSNVVIIKGIVPATLPLVKAERIAFLSIDMNCAEPEIAAGEFFWDKLVAGAVIVLDDYGWTGYIEQKHAWDKFAQDRNTMVLALPTGQGIIIKT